MESKTYKAIEEAALEGAIVLREVLHDRETDDGRLALGRMGSAAVSALAKLYQANSAREATVVSIISHAAPDAEEFRRLVQAALPGSLAAKALVTEGNGKAQSGDA